jgi:hypothetical protein
LQASVHLLNETGDELVRVAHAGLDSIAPPERIALGEGFVGEVVEDLYREDMTKIDLEPETDVCLPVQGMAMICPMAAGCKFLGLLHVVLPMNLANDYLYTRVPMTLAHHGAMAFYAADLLNKQAGKVD